LSTEPRGFAEAPDGTLAHFVDLDLHAEALHTEVSDPVVLIHGLGCNWHHWSRQIGWIAHSRRVVAVDVRGGGGKTRWARPRWSSSDMAADVHAVVTDLGLRRPAIVGCSMGGTIALQYALDYPADLSRLVVLASFAGLPKEMARTSPHSGPISRRIPCTRSPRSEWVRRSPRVLTGTSGPGWST
jgi:pimeloyl-ACP methyl ester carboxylesterase